MEPCGNSRSVSEMKQGEIRKSERNHKQYDAGMAQMGHLFDDENRQLFKEFSQIID
jgi:hypothetical protein